MLMNGYVSRQCTESDLNNVVEHELGLGTNTTPPLAELYTLTQITNNYTLCLSKWLYFIWQRDLDTMGT